MTNYLNNNRQDVRPFYERYVSWYDSRRKIERVRSRSKQDSFADLYDIIDMIDLLIERHQMTWVASYNSFKLTFPYMFLAPDVGDKIRNLTTNEEYTIIYVGRVESNLRRPAYGPFRGQPANADFDGVLILNGTIAPKYGEELEYVDKEKNLIHFFEWGNKRSNSSPNNIGDAHERDRRFNPCVSWSITRVEPGSTGKKPFDPQKMHTNVLFEQCLDPDNTVLLGSAFYEQSKQLQNLFPTGQPLVTGEYSPLTYAQQDPRLSTHIIEVYGQWYDNLVQFDCWSTDNSEANRLVVWFEDFMELYTPQLRTNGASQILFWERMRDQTIERWRDDIDNRTTVYYMRTQKIRTRRLRTFRKYNFKIQIGTSDNPELYTEPIGISSLTGRYGLNASQYTHSTLTGVSGHFTGDEGRLWGTLSIMQ